MALGPVPVLEQALVPEQAPAVSEVREPAGALPAGASVVVIVSAIEVSEVVLRAAIVAALEADPEASVARLRARAAVVAREVSAGLAVEVADHAVAADAEAEDAEAVVVVEGGNHESHDKHQMDGGWAVVFAIARR